MTAASNRNVQIVAITVGVLLMVGKFVAWSITGSNAILTDALESIINVVAASVALYSIYLASRPRDLNHPYGHGKVEFLSSGFEGGLIVVAGVAIAAKSVYNLFYPTALAQLDLGLAITALTGIVNYGMGLTMVRQGRSTQSITLEAGGKHLLTDAYSTIALIVGLGVVIATGYTWLDSLMAIAMGGYIIYAGWRIVRRSIAGIMDEADYELIKEMVTELNDHRSPNWIDVHNLRVIKYGATLHVDCHITLPWYFNVREAHDELDAFEGFFEQHSERPYELFVHSDPCIPESCAICTKPNCPVRQQPFMKRVEWTMTNVVKNQKHYYEGVARR